MAASAVPDLHLVPLPLPCEPFAAPLAPQPAAAAQQRAFAASAAEHPMASVVAVVPQPAVTLAVDVAAASHLAVTLPLTVAVIVVVVVRAVVQACDADALAALQDLQTVPRDHPGSCWRLAARDVLNGCWADHSLRPAVKKKKKKQQQMASVGLCLKKKTEVVKLLQLSHMLKSQ